MVSFDHLVSSWVWYDEQQAHMEVGCYNYSRQWYMINDIHLYKKSILDLTLTNLVFTDPTAAPAI